MYIVEGGCFIMISKIIIDKKFEKVDNFIKEFDILSNENRCRFINNETEVFINLSEKEKIECHYKLLFGMILNKHYCIKRIKMFINFYSDSLSLIKKDIINNRDNNIIIDSIDSLLSEMQEDFDNVEKDLKYHRKYRRK